MVSITISSKLYSRLGWLVLTTSLLTGCVQETTGLRFNEVKDCWEPRNVEVPYSSTCDQDDGGLLYQDPDDGSFWSFSSSCVPEEFVSAGFDEIEPFLGKPKCYELE